MSAKTSGKRFGYEEMVDACTISMSLFYAAPNEMRWKAIVSKAQLIADLFYMDTDDVLCDIDKALAKEDDIA